MPSSDQIHLRTPRLLLRPMTRSDAAALFRMFSDPAVSRYLSHPPWTNLRTAHQRIDEDQQAMSFGKYYRFGIEDASSKQLIGECSLFNLIADSRRAEIGYVLDQGSWGCGYMSEALKSLLHFGFEQLGLNRIEADIDPRNRASANTLKRLGFKMEGRLRERWIVQGEISDSELYGLLLADWVSHSGSSSGGRVQGWRRRK